MSTRIGTVWRAMLVLAVLGLADSAYLTWYHYDPSVRTCVVNAGCEVVNASRYATVGAIPVALLGLAGYGSIIAALICRRWGPSPLRLAASYVTYGLALLGTGVSLYLTGVEIAVLRALCPWCLFSAAIMVTLCGAATCDLADRRRE